MRKWLYQYFGIIEKKSSIQTEIFAGISTFLTLSYIFVVNPAILAQGGMDKTLVFFATVLTSGLATLIMGMYARLPFALAPGMEINAYVAFFVIGVLGYSWPEALGAVFWSGVIFVVLTIARVRERIIDAIPERMKSGLSLAVGVFLSIVALKVARLLIYEGVTIKGLGNFRSSEAIAFYVSTTLVFLLDRLHVRGAVLISILATSILYHFIGTVADQDQTSRLSSALIASFGKLDLGVVLNPKSLSVILILFLVDFYGSVAKLIGLTMSTNIMVNGKLPRMKEALLIDGTSTLLGAGLGTTSLTVYVESGVGIGTGGRTGLTSVVTGVLMLSCFLITPLLKFVPVIATTGALIFVGTKLFPSWRELRSYNKLDNIVFALMQLIVVITFAIDKAMLAGFLVYIFIDLLAFRRPNIYLVGSATLLTLGLAL